MQAAAFDQIVHQILFEGRIGGNRIVFHAVFVAFLFDVIGHAVELLQVILANLPGEHRDLLARLRIDKLRFSE